MHVPDMEPHRLPEWIIRDRQLRRWDWANRLREQLVQSASSGQNPLHPNTDAHMYLSLWLAMLYSVLESLEADEIPALTPDIDDLRDTLRRFRNAVFHVNFVLPEFLYNKNVSEKLVKIHAGVGEYLHQALSSASLD